MTSSLPFAKYHGIGNDFLIVDLRRGDASPSPQTPEAARALCDRRFGVGGDGVLAVLAASAGVDADARMRVLNSDGSEAEMCGNGIRCVAKHLYDTDPAMRRPTLRIETGAGVLACGITAGPDGRAGAVSVSMGRPRPGEGRDLDVGRTFALTEVSMGNPHAVAFVDETGASLRALAERFGPTIETHAWFPKKTNVEMAHVVSPTEIELVVWERGCGITLACGTGACATAVAASLNGLARPGTEIRVRLLGGELAVTVEPELAGVTMRGPAELVFQGSVDLSALLR